MPHLPAPRVAPRPAAAALLAVLTAALLQACAAAAPPAGDITPATQPAAPTAADRQLMTELDRLEAALDGNRGTEVLNLLRDPGDEARAWAGFSKGNVGPVARERLRGKTPATQAQLDEARRVFTLNVQRLQLIEKSPAPAPLDVLKRKGDIRIDGRLDEPEWKRAAPVPLNVRFRFTISGGEPDNPSAAQVLWDEQGLYVGYRIADKTIHPGKNQRDDMSFLWDCVELYLLADPVALHYWEINVTPGGSFNDMLCHKRPRLWSCDRDLPATIEGMKFAVSVYGTPDDAGDADAGYVIELFVPWKGVRHLAAVPAAGSTMRALLSYGDIGDPVGYPTLRFFSDVPMMVGYQDLWNFRTWRFVDEK